MRHTNIDSELRKRLGRFFVTWNKKFYKVAGRDFGWEADEGI